MRTRLRSQVAFLATIGMLAAGALIAGCSGGSVTGISIAEEAGGPTVPFSFTSSGRAADGVPVKDQGNLEFDAVAPQSGGIDGNWTFNSDTAVSLCTWDCPASHSVYDPSSGKNRCYTNLSEELGSGYTGHSIEVTIVNLNSVPGLTPSTLAADTPDMNHTGRFNNFDVTAGSEFLASGTGQDPDNDRTRNDFITLEAKCVDTFSSSGTGNQAALRFVVFVDKDMDGNSTMPVADGDVYFTPDVPSGSADNLSENQAIVTTDTSLLPDLSNEQSAAIAYSIVDPQGPLIVHNGTNIEIPLAMTEQHYSGLNFLGMICDESGGNMCLDPRLIPPAP